jgi:hypothetical protein
MDYRPSISTEANYSNGDYYHYTYEAGGNIILSARYTLWGDMLEMRGLGNFAFGYPSIALRASLSGVLDAATGLLYIDNGQ